MKSDCEIKIIPACHRRVAYLCDAGAGEDICAGSLAGRRIWVVIALVILLSLLAWALAPRGSHAETVNKIAAVVGSSVITELDLSRAMAAKGRGKDARPPDAALRQETLDHLIDETLLNQLLAKSKVEVAEDDMAKAIANILHRNRMSIEQLKNEIAAKGISYDDYKKQIERDIKRIKFINQVIGPQVKVSDQDLRDHYQNNQDQFRSSHQAHISEIVLPLEGINSQAEFDALGETALSIAAKARHGTNFDSLVKQYSKAGNTTLGGDLGMVNLKDLPPAVADAVRGMKIGDVSNPVVTQNAIVIVKLIALPEVASGDFDKLRDDIYAAIYDRKVEEAMNGYLLKERQRAFVEIR